MKACAHYRICAAKQESCLKIMSFAAFLVDLQSYSAQCPSTVPLEADLVGVYRTRLSEVTGLHGQHVPPPVVAEGRSGADKSVTCLLCMFRVLRHSLASASCRSPLATAPIKLELAAWPGGHKPSRCSGAFLSCKD